MIELRCAFQDILNTFKDPVTEAHALLKISAALGHPLTPENKTLGYNPSTQIKSQKPAVTSLIPK